MEDAVKAVFSGFGEETRKKLTYAPKDGEWVERIRFWQEALRPALPPHVYHKVMSIFLDWAVRCSRARLGGAA